MTEGEGHNPCAPSQCAQSQAAVLTAMSAHEATTMRCMILLAALALACGGDEATAPVTPSVERTYRLDAVRYHTVWPGHFDVRTNPDSGFRKDSATFVLLRSETDSFASGTGNLRSEEVIAYIEGWCINSLGCSVPDSAVGDMIQIAAWGFLVQQPVNANFTYRRTGPLMDFSGVGIVSYLFIEVPANSCNVNCVSVAGTFWTPTGMSTIFNQFWSGPDDYDHLELEWRSP